MPEIFIPPSPSEFETKPPKQVPPRLPTPPPGALYTPHPSNVALSSPGHMSCMAFPSPMMPPWFYYRVQPVPLLLHHHLCWYAHSGAPVLNWDIIHSPEYSRIYDAASQTTRFKAPDMNAAALQPSASKVWIMSNHLVLSPWMQRWGAIVIEKDTVTVADILNSVYSYLRTPLTRDDLKFAATTPQNKDNLRAVLAIRAKDAHELNETVLRGGYRRVDVLGAHRRFKGLEIVALPDQTWRLSLDLLPGKAPRFL